jgi:3-deoxy-D-manno-octulosonic-acid transferase
MLDLFLIHFQNTTVLFLYELFIRAYPLLARAISPWNPKASRWVEGRRDLMPRLRQAMSRGDGPVVWMHCASLGEFEQGRPVLERIRSEYPGHRILLTFFSPSGYEVRKDYPGAHHVEYLPMDSPAAASGFMDTVRPVLAIFVKYEFWHHYLEALKARGVPTLLVSGIFRLGQPFFRAYGSFWRSMLGCFTHLFLQDQDSLDLLKGIGLGVRSSISGDTRFDRVSEIAQTGFEVPGLAQFCGSYDVLVAGSTWEEDEDVLVHFVNQRIDLRTIIAPHEPGPSEIADIRRKFHGTLLYSEWKAGRSMEGARVLILDGMGMLASAYRHATITYVGGGFGDDGVHNVLEAAVYDKPVFIGPEYDKFREAVELVDLGGAIVVDSAVKLEREMTLALSNGMDRYGIGTIAGEYVRQRTGATESVMRYIQENRLLTN